MEINFRAVGIQSLGLSLLSHILVYEVGLLFKVVRKSYCYATHNLNSPKEIVSYRNSIVKSFTKWILLPRHIYLHPYFLRYKIFLQWSPWIYKIQQILGTYYVPNSGERIAMKSYIVFNLLKLIASCCILFPGFSGTLYDHLFGLKYIFCVLLL